MTIDELQKQYRTLDENENYSFQEFNVLCKALKEANTDEMLRIHFSFLVSTQNAKLHNSLLACFGERPRALIENFLVDQIKTTRDPVVQGDAIHILGLAKSQKVLAIAEEYIGAPDRVLRYKSIIVLGWVGMQDQLPILEGRLLNDPDDQLRAYSATAMRQLYKRVPKASDAVLEVLKKALVKEQAEVALQGILIVLQDLLKTKFGLKEDIQNAKILGDVRKAKKAAVEKLKL